MDKLQRWFISRWGNSAPDLVKRTVLGSLIAVCLALLLTLRMAPPGVARADPPTPPPNCPYNHVWDGHECKEIKPPPCPAGTIDIQGNGQNDGGDDCQPFRHITPPFWCAPASPDGNGNVGCFLPQGGLGWDGRFVQASMGCLAIDREPFPRALVDYPQQPGGAPGTKFRLYGSDQPSGNGMAPWIVPPERLATLGMTEGRSGWYRPATDMSGLPGVGNLTDAVRGPGLASNSSGAILPFNTRVILQSHSIWTGDKQNYDIDHVRAALVFVRAGDPEWSFPENNLPFLNDAGTEVFFRFPRASFPTDINGYVTNDGLDLQEQATLPAFSLVVQSVWDLWYWASWDNYRVVNNEAQYAGTSVVRNHVGQYVSSRVWGVGMEEAVWQPSGGATPICNQASYVPVPVVEGQAVLTR